MKKFNVVSLRDWLHLCQIAKVPCVEAEAVAHVPKELITSYKDETEWEERPETKHIWKQIADSDHTIKQSMLRWDCCAPFALKANFSGGMTNWIQEYARRIYPFEPRTIDILYEFPEETITIWRRPWMQFAIHDKWPVEYRVFVEDSKIVGISNYYIQRDLTNWPDTIEDIAKVEERTRALIEAGGPKSFSADFMRLIGPHVEFLEGGPPFSSGKTHPCCFMHLPEPWSPTVRLAVATPEEAQEQKREKEESRYEEAITDQFLYHTRDGQFRGVEIVNEREPGKLSWDDLYDLAGDCAVVVTESTKGMSEDEARKAILKQVQQPLDHRAINCAAQIVSEFSMTREIENE